MVAIAKWVPPAPRRGHSELRCQSEHPPQQRGVNEFEPEHRAPEHCALTFGAAPMQRGVPVARPELQTDVATSGGIRSPR